MYLNICVVEEKNKNVLPSTGLELSAVSQPTRDFSFEWRCHSC